MNKVVLGVVVIVLILVGVTLLQEKTDSPLPGEPKIVTREVAYFGDVSGYFARPEAEGTYPALILIHEWWGLNDNLRKLARDFAKEGYVALAVDLYEGESTDTPDMARELAGRVRGDMDGAFENLQAAVAYLRAQPEVVDDRLASVGWCFGGGWSYEMAKNDLGVAASIIYYGQFNPQDDLSQMRASILGHFGEEDRSISVDSVHAFQVKLRTLSGDHQIFIYPNAGHAFANDDSMAYVPEAAELAWERTLSFLNEEL